MTLKKIYLPEQSYFITTNVLNKEWIFGKLKNGLYLPQDELCQTLINVLDSLRKIMGFLLHGYVIMPHHLHLILTTAEDESSATRSEGNTDFTQQGSTIRFNDHSVPNCVGEDLSSPSTNISQIMKLVKGRSARILNNLLVRSGQLWQHSFYEHCIRNEKDFMEKLNYIHFNPIKANLVQDPLTFQYSSYRNYYSNDDSIIKIDRFDL